MNTFMQQQIKLMLDGLTSFESSLRISALKDDGTVSKQEARQLKRVEKATSRFRKALERVVGE